MKNMNGKLKFKKEKTTFRDTFLFVLIFILCAATVVTIQLKSKKKTDIADTVSDNKMQKNEIDEQTDTDVFNYDETTYAPEKGNEDKQTKTDVIVKDELMTKNDETATPTQEKTVQAFDFCAPCGGEITKEFSDSDLLYSDTMDDWRIHLGIDISVPIGTQIKACEDGIAEEIKNDPEYGNTVVIRHNDILTKYSNLASESLPVIGNKIKKGDVIGVVGDSAQSEILDKSHLHFAMCENNIYIDPRKYIGFDN